MSPWRKSVSEAPIAASVTSVSRMRRERRASRRRSSAGSVCRFGNRGMLREDDPEERREATEDEFKVFHFWIYDLLFMRASSRSMRRATERSVLR